MTARGPGSRAERYRIGLLTLGSLVAGRASYRLVLLVTIVALLPIWGEQRYGTYAAAMASFSWLMALVFTGPEKTVLKLRPRAPRVGAEVSEALLAVLWWAPLPLAVGFSAVLVTAGGDAPATVYLGVATMHLSGGCMLLLVGLHRAAGRPRPDALTFLTLSVAQLALLAGAAAGYVGPAGYLAAIILVQSTLNIGLTVALGRPSLRIRRRPRLLVRLLWTALLLGSADLFLYLTTAVLFALLALAGHAEQVARLYVVTLVWSAGVNMLLYVLRVYAPRTALRLTGRAGWAGRARAARLAGWTAAGNAGWLLAAVTALGLTGTAGATAPATQTLIWVMLLVTRAPAVAALLWASYQLENTDATAPRVVGLAALVGISASTVAGLLAVPGWGGVGLIIAVAVGEAAYALVIAVRGGGPARPPAIGGSARPSAAGGQVSRRWPGGRSGSGYRAVGTGNG